MLSSEGLPTPTRAQYHQFIGEGLRRLVERAAPDVAPARTEHLIAEFRRYYGEHLIVRSRLYPGIDHILDRLRDVGTPIGVLSNKPDAMTQRIGAALLAAWPLAGISGERSDTPRKPDPAGAFRMAQLLDVAADECVLVGDTKTDMLTARAAGMTGIGVTWGFRDRAELEQHGATHVVDTPAELLNLLVRS